MGKVIKLTFLGDMLCQREQIAAVKKAKCGYDVVFDQVKHLWSDSDYVVGNLETPIAGKKLRYAYEAMRFNAPEDFLKAIKNAGITFLSTANNHALDRGVDGLNKTLENLDSIGLEHDGTFATKADSEQIFVKDFDGFRIAFISCTYGTNQGLKCNYLPDDELWRVRILKYPEQVVTTKLFLLRRFISNLIPMVLKKWLRVSRGRAVTVKQVFLRDSVPSEEMGNLRHKVFEENIRHLISRANEIADFVIVLPHVGGQYCSDPGEYQLYAMNLLAEAGADLIVANHAHIPQKALRCANGALGFCALGDFCFTPSMDGADRLSDYSIALHILIDAQSNHIDHYEYDVIQTTRRDDGISVCRISHGKDDIIRQLMEVR